MYKWQAQETASFHVIVKKYAKRYRIIFLSSIRMQYDIVIVPGAYSEILDLN
jgi:hypothetical protein